MRGHMRVVAILGHEHRAARTWPRREHVSPPLSLQVARHSDGGFIIKMFRSVRKATWPKHMHDLLLLLVVNDYYDRKVPRDLFQVMLRIRIRRYNHRQIIIIRGNLFRFSNNSYNRWDLQRRHLRHRAVRQRRRQQHRPLFHPMWKCTHL